MKEFNQLKNTMAQLELYQMTYGRVQLNQKNCANVQIKSNYPWQTLINLKSAWQISKLYQRSHGIPQLAQKNHGRVEIKSNDS